MAHYRSRLARWSIGSIGPIATICVAAVASASPVPIVDFGFEDDVKSVGEATGPGSWVAAGGAGGGANVYSPTTPLPGQDGDRVGRLFVRNQAGSFGVQFQDVTKIQEGTYIATFNASYEPGFEPNDAPLHFNFESIAVGGAKEFLGGDSFFTGTIDNTQMVELVASVTIGPDAPAVGKFLRLVPVTGGTDPGMNELDPCATYNIDNIRLEYVPLDSSEGTAIPVGDPSFEAKPWQTGTNETGASGVFRPAAPLFGNQQGSQLGFLSVRNNPGSFAAMFQDIPSIAVGTYTMTVAAAHDPDHAPTTGNLLVNFEAIAADGTKTLLEQNTFVPATLDATTLTNLAVDVTIPEGSPHLGKALRLVLVNVGPDGGSNPSDPRATYLVDNVRLDFQAPGGFSADFNGDGSVNSADFNQWKQDYGEISGGGWSDADNDGDSDGGFSGLAAAVRSGPGLTGFPSQPLPVRRRGRHVDGIAAATTIRLRRRLRQRGADGSSCGSRRALLDLQGNKTAKSDSLALPASL